MLGVMLVKEGQIQSSFSQSSPPMYVASQSLIGSINIIVTMTVVLPMEFERMEGKFRSLGLEKLAPPPEVYKLCWKPEDIFQEVDGKRYRRIFFNVQYELQEIKDIAEIRRTLLQQNINDLFTDAIILKNYIAGKFSYKKCVERLRSVHQFHTDIQLTQYSQQTIRGLERGFIYTYGYDREYCPVVYTRPDLIDFEDEQFLNPIYCIMYIVQRFRMVPYHAQKYLLVVDLNDMNVSDIPYMKIYKIMHNVSCLYTGFIKRVLVLNSSGIGTMWTIVKRFIPERAKKNIVFIQSYQELDDYIDKSQRERKYEGILPNLETYWPPESTTPQTIVPTTLVSNKSYISLKESSVDIDQYYSIENNQELFYKLAEMQAEEKKCNCKCSLI